MIRFQRLGFLSMSVYKLVLFLLELTLERPKALLGIPLNHGNDGLRVLAYYLGLQLGLLDQSAAFCLALTVQRLKLGTLLVDNCAEGAGLQLDLLLASPFDMRHVQLGRVQTGLEIFHSTSQFFGRRRFRVAREGTAIAPGPRVMPPRSRVCALGSCAKVGSIDRRRVASSHGSFAGANATAMRFQRKRTTATAPKSCQDVTKLSYHEKQVARRERFIISRCLLLVVVGNLVKGLERWRGKLSHREAPRGRSDAVNDFWVCLWLRHAATYCSLPAKREETT